ncbi:hypothetical protein [Halobaculum litoreum]|uniref:hypothetical protein n=1 Tax=Halobaculum litoreum TaxID=3031998 RepID=UPI0024C2A47A|nr:hypothetical protein [Halobaculum sp. DT92]
MVLVRHPLYVAVGATVSVYGIAYALTGGGFEAAAVATLPGAWLAAHGLLNGIALATDDGRRRAHGDEGPGDEGPGEDGSDSDGDDPDDRGAAASASDVVARTPY